MPPIGQVNGCGLRVTEVGLVGQVARLLLARPEECEIFVGDNDRDVDGFDSLETDVDDRGVLLG